MFYKKMGLVSLLIVIISILASSYLLLSQANVIKNNISVIANTKQEISKLSKELTYLSGFEQKSEDMKTILNEYSLAFPHTAEESSIVILLNKIAEKNALKFNDIRFNEKINKDKLTKIPITINLTGDYFDIIKYIVEIKKLDRVFSISSIVIAREYDGSQNVIADITLNIYNISN